MKGNVSTWRDFYNEVVGGSSPFCVFVDRYVVVVVVVEVVVVEVIVVERGMKKMCSRST
jgi:hypothetical protein